MTSIILRWAIWYCPPHNSGTWGIVKHKENRPTKSICFKLQIYVGIVCFIRSALVDHGQVCHQNIPHLVIRWCNWHDNLCHSLPGNASNPHPHHSSNFPEANRPCNTVDLLQSVKEIVPPGVWMGGVTASTNIWNSLVNQVTLAWWITSNQHTAKTTHR